MRGINIGDSDNGSIVIMDELQNFSIDELKKVLTRISDKCKVILIGHTGQIDLSENKQSGFEKYIEHFKEHDKVAICNLTVNHRGWISSWADEM